MKKIILLLIISITGFAIKGSSQCQNITASVTSNPLPDADTILRICQGTTVTFTGTATFATTSVGATYDWRINNTGGYSSTTTLTHTFAVGGVYVVDFVPMDSAGCVSKDCNSRMVVHVSTRPSFEGTTVPDSICINSMVSIGGSGIPGGVTGVVTPDTPTYNCAPPISDTTFLPDGSGVSYSTSIDVTCFTSCDSISDGSQINNICLNMEHSFLGDLEIKIVCPSGQEAIIKEYPGGGGTYLGGAIDDGTLVAGVGADYCFNDDATRSDMLTELALGTTVIAGTPPSASMAPGEYKPKESFDNLIGCPLNGSWTIVVTDNLFVDNGYIFGWNIDFDFDVASYSFFNNYPSQEWSGPPEIIGTGPAVTIKPQIAGLNCYTFTVIDNFGCNYDTTLCTFVKDMPDPGLDSAASVCPNVGPISLFDYLGGTPEIGGIWTGPSVTATGTLNPAALVPGTYEYTYTVHNTFCDTSAILTLTIENDFDIDFDFEVFKGCNGDTVVFESLTDSLTYFRWNFGDGSAQDTSNIGPMHIYEEQGEYGVWFVGKNQMGCIDSVQKLVNTLHPLEAIFTQSNDSVCQHIANTVAFFDESIGNITYWDWDFGDGGTSTLQNPTHTFTTAGTYTVRLIVTDNIPCTDTVYSTVYVDPTPYLSIQLDKDSICRGDMVTVTALYPDQVTDMMWNFGDGVHLDLISDTVTHNYSDTGVYEIMVVTQHPVCPEVSDRDSIYIKPYPQINLGTDTAICLNGAPIYMDPATLVSNPAGTVYYWNTGDSASLLKITAPGIYRVTADLDGCLTTDEFVVNKDCYIDVPNAFSPNGDGDNDYFFPRQLLSEGVVDFKMVVYNRWGKTVFETTQTDGRGWDGTFNGEDQPFGIYVYQITVRYKNQAAEKYTGNITLLR